MNLPSLMLLLIALATFFLSGLTVRSEVKEHGEEIDRQIETVKDMSVKHKDFKKELSV